MCFMDLLAFTIPTSTYGIPSVGFKLYPMYTISPIAGHTCRAQSQPTCSRICVCICVRILVETIPGEFTQQPVSKVLMDLCFRDRLASTTYGISSIGGRL